MPADPLLSLFSDRLFMGAVAVYVLAMLLHAAEYVTAREAAGAREPAVVGAAAGAVPELAVPIEPPEPPGRSRSDRFGRMAVSVTVLGVLLHLGSIVLRGLAAARWPLGNMYEYSAAICLFAVATWLVVLRRSPSLRRVGVFVLPPVLVLMFLGGTVLYARAAPLVPALQSYWLVVHVTTVTLASGLFLVAGVASLLYLLRRSDMAPGVVEGLPSTAVLDRLAYRVTVVAFPIYTFAVIAGAVWAEAAWGRFWGWDPKETVAFVAWVVYAAYLHARATAGWRAGPAALINALGFAVVVFNLFFINMVVAGLHSYAGV